MSGPLNGVRVLDISTVLAGPLASSLLGEFGAEVIKVEQPGIGDPARSYPPLDDGVSAGWAVVGRNKSSVTVDLHHPDAAALVGQLAATADVVVTNFRPATLRRFSIDFDDLVSYRPDLVMVHVSAFGRTGPYADRPGFARVAEAFAGLTHRTGFPDGPPVFAGYPVADGVTGIYAAFAAMLALRQRDLTGEPQLADIGLYEPLLRMMEDFVVDYDATGEVRERQGNENPHISPNNLYRTRDGRWLALPASTEQMWRRLLVAMEAPDLAAYDSMTARIEHRGEIEGRVAAFVAAHDLEPLTNLLENAGGGLWTGEHGCRHLTRPRPGACFRAVASPPGHVPSTGRQLSSICEKVTGSRLRPCDPAAPRARVLPGGRIPGPVPPAFSPRDTSR
ncbi:CaiB/BaiF CoA transferase family protein [Streptomyces sp. NBC_00316]|uniref:CaiB/BaiF CoA transferase family protein n=1 Tax=Streptomyces sp. NBC_00316 TaxID=2975710 RepID=UPI002E29B9F4|nr:CoA transferase [Streptomyces sp. NBC_00316]